MNKEKLPLIVGILIPIFLVALVFIYSFIPSLIIKPQYDFIYAKQDYNDSKLDVISGQLQLSESESSRYEDNDEYENYYEVSPEPEIYYYSVSDSRSRRISYDEASGYRYISSKTSPDGFNVGRVKSSESYFPFYFTDEDFGMYLKGKGLKKKISSVDDYSMKFIGWVDK